jgi:hypothetical protein
MRIDRIQAAHRLRKKYRGLQEHAEVEQPVIDKIIEQIGTPPRRLRLAAMSPAIPQMGDDGCAEGGYERMIRGRQVY